MNKNHRLTRILKKIPRDDTKVFRLMRTVQGPWYGKKTWTPAQAAAGRELVQAIGPAGEKLVEIARGFS